MSDLAQTICLDEMAIEVGHHCRVACRGFDDSRMVGYLRDQAMPGQTSPVDVDHGTHSGAGMTT